MLEIDLEHQEFFFVTSSKCMKFIDDSKKINIPYRKVEELITQDEPYIISISKIPDDCNMADYISVKNRETLYHNLQIPPAFFIVGHNQQEATDVINYYMEYLFNCAIKNNSLKESMDEEIDMNLNFKIKLHLDDEAEKIYNRNYNV
jgi:hypothetical protein